MVANFKNNYYVWLINTTQPQLSTATQKQMALLNKKVKNCVYIQVACKPKIRDRDSKLNFKNKKLVTSPT